MNQWQSVFQTSSFLQKLRDLHAVHGIETEHRADGIERFLLIASVVFSMCSQPEFCCDQLFQLPAISGELANPFGGLLGRHCVFVQLKTEQFLVERHFVD